MSNVTTLQDVFGEFKTCGDEMLFFCPFCHHRKRKLSVNRKTHCWKCWVCNQRGRTLFSLLWLSGHKERSKVVSGAATIEAHQDFEFSLPSEFRALAEHPVSLALQYLQRRNVSSQHILRHKIGFCDQGRYSQRIVLPSFSSAGRANFFTARAIGAGSPKYLNPSTPGGYKRSIILNELNLQWNKPIVIVEGFFDMLRVPNATPLFGSVIADDSKLFQELVMRDVKTFVCLDADARAKQLDIIAALNAFGAKAYDVNLPYGDVASVPSNVLAEAFKRATRLDRVQLLKERMRL